MNDGMIRILMVLCILLPIAATALLLLLKPEGRGKRVFLAGTLALEAAMATALAFAGEGEMTLFSMTEKLVVALRVDGISRLFLLIAAYGYLLSGVFALRYMEHEGKEAFPENMFYSFYLLSLSALAGMDLAANLVTMYFFFELITLLSMPLVLHERTRESIGAALKYLFYSVAGAFLALGSIFVLSTVCTAMDFVPGGTVSAEALSAHGTLVLVASFLGVVGFGAKAGMYPLHGWLPTAHPVAPAPASAVLSAIIAKAGVLAIIRLVYYTVGAQVLEGTWVQLAWLGLALLTVFMGSMMAYREKVLKKRLAYSSVSQISYALFGVFLLNGQGLTGGLMQVLFHATVKICLFLCAGSVIFNTGYHTVDELKGLGKKLPVTFGCFTLASLSLIGIPPFAGFVCKWYLAEGALSSGIAVFSWLGPVVLLISALLTAGYLLPVSIQAFFPGQDYRDGHELHAAKEGGLLILIPLMILAVLALVMGICSGTVRELLFPVLRSLGLGL